MAKGKQLVEHLFRTEYGKLVGILTRMFGTSNIQMAEDIVQDTLISALNHWSIDGIPDKPSAWLVQVAKRKVLNELKRNKTIQKHLTTKPFTFESKELEDFFLPEEIEDNQLRMIFTCCHPSLNTASQIALTLKTLCGFGIQEVANALLTNSATINKRLYRAKKGIRESKLPFQIPSGQDLENRIETVQLTLYLLFNEGYNSTTGNSIIQKDLCLESIRLTQLLVNRFKDHKTLRALLALMCFHTARFESRIDDNGAIVLFEDQDRQLWNQDLINIGMLHLKNSMHAQNLSTYHIEANIAAEHCLSISFHTTNWSRIYKLYQLLEKLKPSPIIRLNLAIIQSKTNSIEASLDMLDLLVKQESLYNYYLLPATQGIFHLKLKNYSQAIGYLKKALVLNPPAITRDFINSKIKICNRLLLE